MMGIIPYTVEVVPFLQRELSNIGIAINPSKTVALPPEGNVPTPEQKSPFLKVLASASPNVEGLRWLGCPSAQMIREGERNGDIPKRGSGASLARMLWRMPGKQSANLIATGSMMQRTSLLEHVKDPELSLAARQKEDGNALWLLEKLLDLPGAAQESSFFAEGCPTNMLALQQQAQACLSTGAGGFGLSSAETRRMS